MSISTEPNPELDALARETIGAAIEVHRALGPGFLESIYEEALCLELTHRRISFARQGTCPDLLPLESHRPVPTGPVGRRPTGRGAQGDSADPSRPRRSRDSLSEGHPHTAGVVAELQRPRPASRYQASDPVRG